MALRASNALLLGILFFAGYWWARYTGFNSWAAASGLTALGIVLVIVAIALGG
jgi:hypothetical protein